MIAMEMLSALGSLTLLGLVLGGLLGTAARYLVVAADPLEAVIEALLPGSQCGQCGYPGCGPAAAALAAGEAAATLCPPGGRVTAEAIASRLGVAADLSTMADAPPAVAHVNEALCIGCTKCFKRCPTDAVMGGPRMIHSVFAEACNGCGSCRDVCPTAGIEMRPMQPTVQTWYWPSPAAHRPGGAPA